MEEAMTDDTSDLRIIAIDLLDEILAEERDALNGIEEEEHWRAQAGALAQFGEGHDPKILARALIISSPIDLAELAHDQRPCRTRQA
jgi:hypothetical protein